MFNRLLATGYRFLECLGVYCIWPTVPDRLVDCSHHVTSCSLPPSFLLCPLCTGIVYLGSEALIEYVSVCA